MIHLNKHFITTEKKLVTFQTVKTNIGFATLGKNEAKSSTVNDAIRTSTLDIVFPINSSCVALLIETAPSQEISETIIDAKVAPPGVSSVRFTLSGTNEYWVYILGKNIVNGYISTDGGVISENDTVSRRLVFTVNSAQQSEPRLEESTPLTEQSWYNYNDFYTGPLLWNSPVGTDENGIPQGQYTYLIYFRDMLSDILDIFNEQFKRPTELSVRTADDFDRTKFSDQIRILGARSKIDRFLRKMSTDPSTQNEIIQQFILYVLNDANSNEVDADKNVHELLETYVINYQFGLVYDARFTNYLTQSEALRISYFNDVRAKLRGEDNSNSLSVYERVYEDTNKQFSYLGGLTRFPIVDSIAAQSTPTADDLRQYVYNQNNTYRDQLIAISWTPTAFSYAAAIARLNEVTVQYYQNVYEYTKQKLASVDTFINQLGDVVFASGGTTGTSGNTVVRLAHEGILQNIRYLKNLINESTNDVWTSSVNLESLIIKTLNKIIQNTNKSEDQVSSLTNLAAAYVNPEEIEIFYFNNTEYGAWKKYTGQIITVNDNVKIFDATFLTGVGRYTFLVRPKKIEIGITNIPGANIISTPDLNDYQSENYFYGWNIEFSQAGQQGQRLGDIRMITSSYFVVDDHRLKISPAIDGVIDFTKNIHANIWANSFTPILIEIEVTEHNFLTLSYGHYAASELDTETGVYTLYDYAGNVYKRWTIGERILQSEGYHRIEFRYPIIISGI